MTRILVPTDFSEQADHALKIASQLAKSINAEIELLHVLDVPERDKYSGMENISFTGEMSGGRGMDDVYFIKLVEKTRERMNNLMAAPELEDLKVLEKIQIGSPYKNIYEETSKGNIDLVVMGTSGTSNWEEELVGSNAERVVRRAKCPVLTVSREVELDQIKKIAYASDFKHNHEKLVTVIRDFSKLFNASIHLVKINTPSDFKNDKESYAILKSFAADNKLENYELHIYNHDNEEDGIISFAEQFNMNMIVMATEGRTGFSRLLEGSIAEDVVNYSKIPVLTFLTDNA